MYRIRDLHVCKLVSNAVKGRYSSKEQLTVRKNHNGSQQATQRSNAQPSIIKGQFLDKKQLAAFGGLSIFTIDAWVSQKREISFVKMGKRVKFATEDVMEWIENNKQYPIP